VGINSLVPLAAFGLALLARTGRPNAAIFRLPMTKWMLAFAALFFVQFFTAGARLYVFERLGAVVGYMLIYYAILRNVTSVERFRGVFAVLVGVHVVVLILHPDVVLDPGKRHYIGGTFLGDGNDFAWSACIAVPMALFLFRHAKSALWRYVWLAALLLLVLAIVGTQSRGGSIALGVVAVYLVLRSRRRVVGLAWLAAIFGAVLLFAPATYFERMDTISTYETDGSAQGRLLAWGTAIRMANDHPFVGVGAGNFSRAFGLEYRPPGVGRRDMYWRNAHSIYFLALGEFGYSGITILLSLILLGLVSTHRIVRRLARGLAPADKELREVALAVHCSLIGFGVAGAFLSGLYYPHLYVLCGMSAAVSLLGRDIAPRRGAQRGDTPPRRGRAIASTEVVGRAGALAPAVPLRMR
jgi:probable O-glycosylation ligase (exosortase A-associated)